MNPRFVVVSVLLLSFVACSGASEPRPTAVPSPAVAKIALAQDPGESSTVPQAKNGGAKKSIVVEGRVRDITKGFAVMKLMDVGLDYCGQVNQESNCDTPWDYCCETDEVQAANSLLVEVHDGDGQPLATPALPGIRLLDRVKVRGELKKTEHGTWVLVADGLFRVERPTVADHVKWPE